FRNNLINLFLGSLIISIIAGLTLSTYLSKSLTVPILKLSKSTKYIKEGYYDDIDLPKSDTFEIQMLSNDIDYLAQSLKVQDEIRKNYAQDISHELRTPLTNLQLHIMAMQDGIIEINDENFNLMLNELDRLNGLVADLKSSFDQGSKNITINNTNFNLTNLLDDIINTSKPNFNNHKINLNANLTANMEVYMDKDKLTQVLYNLLSNALKATPEEGYVTVSLKRTSDKILISVNDTGIGISEKDLEQIFNRFYRVDNARNTKENGYGLGLSIVKNMMDAMGGKIIVNSKENIGTEFILEFNKEMVKAIEIIEPNIE
ncbi:MAG: HAMP domain-containing histidine kinase, partial [Tissierellia bacterium]|nr:HAMP domain-containing histidine kinase [Tissierellia bacterium]